MLNMKRRLSLKKRRTNLSSTVASVCDVEDRVIMVCEDIPSETSQDSGRGSQSSRDCSNRDSQTEDGSGWSSAYHLPERELGHLHGGLRMEDLTMMADSSCHTRDFFSVPSAIHFHKLTGCASFLTFIDAQFYRIFRA